MGILANAMVIGFGGIFGSKLKKFKINYHTVGIGIMMISLVSFLQNMYYVKEKALSAENLMVVLISFLIGSKIGEAMHLDELLSYSGRSNYASFNAFVEATLFFGIGGMQFSGPITLAINHNNDQLFFKCLVDAPFALLLGSTYGKIVAFSSIPVALLQVLIALTAYMFTSLFSEALIGQICAIGYIALFFSGFNLMTNWKYNISNINMLPGIILVILFNIVKVILEGLA